MEIGEKNKLRAQELVFGWQRLLDLEHHSGALPYCGRRAEDLCPGFTKLLVSKSTANAGAAFDADLMAMRGERAGTRRCQRHSALVRFDFTEHSYDHFFTCKQATSDRQESD